MANFMLFSAFALALLASGVHGSTTRDAFAGLRFGEHMLEVSVFSSL